ncbi:DUF4476 domain-containing protein [Microscilla marina]|uniref:DUF4476 domain-containing protein n=1 Tax=Microscilla marina ATCC 23134 TaxID=313606 RepID=A1ZKJ3_MICM2|nr:DUF4476 domain-containing protein [Microscilla marina]EAY29219.1 hypothetical protein M23134_02410 [Microscilla marina ATCC 23134]
MKKFYYLTLIGLIFSSSLFAQNRRQGCTNPLSNYAFQQKYKSLDRQPNESYKLKAAINLIRLNCMTSSQVKQIAASFQTDQSRVAFVKEAYLKTYDRRQFHHVYDAFKSFRNVARAHQYIMALRKGGSGGTGNTGQVTFPHWNYPTLAGYQGTNNCNSFISQPIFMNYAHQVHRQSDETSRYTQAWQALTSNCMTTAQVMKMVSLVKQDNHRLALLKGAFDRVYDVGNYASARVALNSLTTQQDFDLFLNSKAGTRKEESCLIDDNDFKGVNSQVKKEWVDRKKLNLLQSIFKTKNKCYSIAQLKTIGVQFTFSGDKLKYAKWAYTYAHKKEDYHQMAAIFRSTFTKRDFMNWLKTQK